MGHNGGRRFRLDQRTLATISAGATPDANGSAWASIPTVTLTDTRQGGAWSIVVANYGPGNTDIWGPNAGTANVTVLNSSFGTLQSFAFFRPAGAFPSQTTFNNSGGTQFVGPNVGFFVPEPTSSALLLGAVGATAVAILRGKDLRARRSQPRARAGILPRIWR